MSNQAPLVFDIHFLPTKLTGQVYMEEPIYHEYKLRMISFFEDLSENYTVKAHHLR